MSLYFEDRMKEEIEDPENDKISFCFTTHFKASIIPINLLNPRISAAFHTVHNLIRVSWNVEITYESISITISKPVFQNGVPVRVWNGNCYITYKLFSDEKMLSDFYCSPRYPLIPEPHCDSFTTPEDAMERFFDASILEEYKAMSVCIEIDLPAKYFIRPFEKPGSILDKRCRLGYPSDMDSDFRFGFLKDGDLIIKCTDGSLPASKATLYLSKSVLKDPLKESNNDEIFVDHAVDVIKPIVAYLHSLCFEMPNSYDLDFADRLFKAIKFFELENGGKDELINAVHYSLCQKFADEVPSFDSTLKWAALACQHSLRSLEELVAITIGNKYFHQWDELFPLPTISTDSKTTQDIFGPNFDNLRIFNSILGSFVNTFFNNGISS